MRPTRFSACKLRPPGAVAPERPGCGGFGAACAAHRGAGEADPHSRAAGSCVFRFCGPARHRGGNACSPTAAPFPRARDGTGSMTPTALEAAELGLIGADRGTQRVETFEPDIVFGEMAMLDGAARSATAVVARHAVVYSLSAACPPPRCDGSSPPSRNGAISCCAAWGAIWSTGCAPPPLRCARNRTPATPGRHAGRASADPRDGGRVQVACRVDGRFQSCSPEGRAGIAAARLATRAVRYRRAACSRSS